MALLTSVLTGGANSHETTAEAVNAVNTDFVTEGIVDAVENTGGSAPATGGFAVNAEDTPSTNIEISAGIAYIDATPTSQNAQTFRVKNTATETLEISANSSGSTKYDWIYIRLDPTNLNTPNTAGDNAATIVASRSSSLAVDDGTPPTYGYCIAVVTVANGFTTITDANITDMRTQAGMQASTATVSTTSWSALGAAPNSVTNNGNRSYNLVFNATDLTSIVSEGMRLRTTRTVSAPTQCASLNGTNQYFNRTTPSGMTFTDDFAVSAWVKLSSYAQSTIVSRFNGTSGWTMRLSTAGVIEVIGYNAGSANFSRVNTFQSIPLNKWVHVAAQLDMSAFSVAGTTNSYIMIDGVAVPASVDRGGTNPTALVQAGNLEIGSTNGGTLPFPGKIAQVAIYSAKVTQATIQASMSQGLTGSETSLISAYSFNNSINDLSATGNNLTAQNSALATNVDSPFGSYLGGTLDYGIITKTAFSTNTTLTVQVPEGCTIPTSGGVSAVSYSTQAVPYLFPRDSGRWELSSLSKSSATITGSWSNVGSISIAVPVGSWDVKSFITTNVARTASTAVEVSGALSESTSAVSDGYDQTISTYQSAAGSATLGAGGTHTGSINKNYTSQTTVYSLNIGTLTSGTLYTNRGNMHSIKAIPAYL